MARGEAEHSGTGLELTAHTGLWGCPEAGTFLGIAESLPHGSQADVPLIQAGKLLQLHGTISKSRTPTPPRQAGPRCFPC